MAAIERRSLLTDGEWEEVNINAITEEGSKISLYYLRNRTVEKVERARKALEQEVSENGQNYTGSIQSFNVEVLSRPYLLKQGNELQLISKQEQSEVMKAYCAASLLNRENTEILAAMQHSHLGKQYANQGKLRDALQEYQTCLTILETCDDQNSLAGTHYNIGWILQRSGELQIAKEHYLKCLDIAKNLKTQEHFVRSCYQSLGILYLANGDKPMALQYLQHFFDLATKQDAQQDIYKASELIQKANQLS